MYDCMLRSQVEILNLQRHPFAVRGGGPEKICMGEGVLKYMSEVYLEQIFVVVGVLANKIKYVGWRELQKI